MFACARCGGRRRVLAYLTAPGGVRTILEHLELPTRPAQRAAAQGPDSSEGGENRTRRRWRSEGQGRQVQLLSPRPGLRE